MDILARTLVICQSFYQPDLPQNVLSHFGFSNGKIDFIGSICIVRWRKMLCIIQLYVLLLRRN